MHRATPFNHTVASAKSSTLNTTGQPARSRMRCLLALDGVALTPRIISAAETKCLNGASRVDILLINSPKAPEAVLHKLLISLEGMGVDYRLTTADGELADLVSQYLRRHKGITQVMIPTLPALGNEWEVKVADLRYQGYRFCTLMGLKDD